MKFDRYLDIARSLYEPNFEHRCQHVSIVTYKNRIISIAKNSIKTTPINLLNPKFSQDGTEISRFRGTCSEWNSLRKIKNTMNVSFSKCRLFNIRINKNKEISNSKPCVSCLSLCRFLDLKEIWFTDAGGNWTRLDS